MATKVQKVVYVSYVVEDTFVIPDGIDLEDKTQVDYYYVHYNVLNIVKIDGTRIEIQSKNYIHTYDYKRPKTIDIDEEEVDEDGMLC
jgi:hypothetical protein